MCLFVVFYICGKCETRHLDSSPSHCVLHKVTLQLPSPNPPGFWMGRFAKQNSFLTNGCVWSIFMLLLRSTLLQVVFICLGITRTLYFQGWSKSLHQVGAGKQNEGKMQL